MTPPAPNLLDDQVDADPAGLSSDKSRAARVVAIIMDGNGRWAEARGVSVAEGHRAGARALRRDGRGRDRPRDRDARRLRVLDRELVAPAGRGRRPDGAPLRDDRRELPDLAKQGVRTRFIGRRDRIEPWLEQQDARARGADGAPRHARSSGSPSTTAGGPRSSTRRGGSSRTASQPARSTRSARGAPLRARAAATIDLLIRDVGRAADLELPALGGGLRRARLHRHALAGLRRRRPARSRRGVRGAPQRASARVRRR